MLLLEEIAQSSKGIVLHYLKVRRIRKGRNTPIELEVMGDEVPNQSQSLGSADSSQQNIDILTLYRQTVEMSALRSWLRWRTGDHMVQKLLYAMAMPQRVFESEDSEFTGKSLVRRPWIHGQAMPLSREGGQRWGLFVDTFRQKTESGLWLPLRVGFPALTLYHVVEYLTPHPQCGRLVRPTFDLLDFVTNIRDSDKRSLAGIVHTSIGNDVVVGMLIGAPFVWGASRGLWQGIRKVPTREEDFIKRITQLEEMGPKWGTKWLSVLPFHPYPGRVRRVQRQLLWNNGLSLEAKERAMESLEGLLAQGGYIQILGLRAMSEIAYAGHPKDVSYLNKLGSLSEEQTDQWEGFKGRALGQLHKEKSFSGKEKKRWLYALYACYMLWSLGISDTSYEAAAWFAFKGTKLGLHIKLLGDIITNVLEAVQCPEPGGYTLAGPTKAAGKNTLTCLKAYINQFGRIPGQNISSITDHMESFYLDVCAFDMDLSGKGLNSQQAGDLIRSFVTVQQDQYAVTLRSLNLSGNGLTDPSFYNEALPLLTGLEVLDLSNNGLGAANSQGTQALGENLKYLTALQSLHLENNAFGYHDSNGTQAIGESLRFLTGLQILDLEGNSYIGSYDSLGVQAIGRSLRFLTNLQTLNLGGNEIGYTDSNGTQAIGQSLRFLTGLQTLSLGNNAIGGYDSLGVQAIGQSLRFLTGLQMLNLGSTSIGYTDSNGTQAIGENLRFLTNLQTLNLENNYIGSQNSLGTQVIGESLRFLTNLQTLNLGNNEIGNTDSVGIQVLSQGLATLQSLKHFTFSPQQLPVSRQGIQLLNQGLQHTQAPLLTLPLSTEEDLRGYFKDLASDLTTVDLSGRLTFSFNAYEAFAFGEALMQ